ncbi:hypothetical protein L210DRAFT_325454 [Boletus edulis BED1]|uniref:Uncharacterized protein n=1 Tax=Boletus edulis BED1 TaxID=1328754 RepID=A0AAD4BC31_BOLED|nr:hypothetical protein L210DRAFT_325454 [Boletus edulis BED1]
MTESAEVVDIYVDIGGTFLLTITLFILSRPKSWMETVVQTFSLHYVFTSRVWCRFERATSTPTIAIGPTTDNMGTG